MPYQQPYMINQQPSQGYGMSDQDIMRLAQALQQQRGEGLAFINPQEQALLKALGGMGQPMPGTQGLGVGGGPIRSYATEDDSSSDSSSSSSSTSGPAGGPVPQTEADKAYEAAKEGYDYVTGRSYEEIQGSGDSGTSSTYTPPPQYKDQYGNKYSTQEEADAADATINMQKTALEYSLSTKVKADTTYQELDDTGFFSHFNKVSAEDIKSIFDKQTRLVVRQSKDEVAAAEEALRVYLSGLNEEQLQTLTFDSGEVELIFNKKVPKKIGEMYGLSSTPKFSYLSLTQQKALFERMRENALREQRFTLTPEERAEFETEAPTVGAVDDATAPTLVGEGEEAPKITAEELAAFYGELDPADAVTISDVYKIEVPPEVGELPALGTVKIDPNGNLVVDETALNAIKQAEDYVAGVLLSRISGVTPSQAELQLRQTTEQNLRALLGAQAGAAADPARLRQIRQIYADTQQTAVGQAALVRTQEQAAAEQQLTEIYKTQGTRELSVALANLETRRQVAIANGELEQAKNVAVYQANLQRLITNAEIARDVELANQNADIKQKIAQGELDQQKAIADLNARTQVLIAEGKSAEAVALANLDVLTTLMVEQGKLDLATALANLQKDLSIATTDAELALKSKALDDAFALAAYEGQLQALGYETQMDIAELEASLKELGFELQRDLAELDAQTQITIAQLTNAARRYAADSNERAAILGAIGTVIGVVASDIRLKMNIKQGEEPRSEIDEFLDNLSAYLFRYKDPDQPGTKHGQQLGVMAQDLMQSDIGKQMVHETPMGLKVDYQSGLAAILAAQADMNDRLKELEGRR